MVLSNKTQNENHVLEALHCRWSSGLFQGQYVAASADAKRGISLYHADPHHHLAALFGGHDPGVCACGVSGWALTALGHVQSGPAKAAASVELADTLTHAHSLAHALMHHANASAVAHSATRLAEISERFNFPPHLSDGRFLQAWVDSEAGNAVSGLHRMTAEYGRVVAIGPMPMFYTALYAEALSKAGRVQAALSVIEQSLRGRPQDVGFHISEVYRIRGDCFHMLGQPEAASRDVKTAAAIAEKQGAKLLRLRATTAGLKLTQKDRETALGMMRLKDVISQMPADADGPDLVEARDMLTS